MPDLWEGRIVRNATTGVTLLFRFARPLGLYVAAATRRRRCGLSIVGIATAKALHGLYAVAVEHILAVAVAAITYLLLVSYIERAELA